MSGWIGLYTPPTSRFPSTLEISQALGNLMSIRHQGWTTQYIPPLGSVHIQYILTWGSLRQFSHHQSIPRDVSLNNDERMYQYTAERKDVLGNTCPEAREIAQEQSQRPRMYFIMHPHSKQCMVVLSSRNQEILSPGQYFSIHSQGSVLKNMIFEDHIIWYHPCCQWIPSILSLQCYEYWQC